MWISRQEWNKMQDKLSNYIALNEIFESFQDSRDLYFYGDFVITTINKYDMLTKIGINNEFMLLQKDNEVKRYKQLYLDELQKRLELAEMVRKNGW